MPGHIENRKKSSLPTLHQRLTAATPPATFFMGPGLSLFSRRKWFGRKQRDGEKERENLLSARTMMVPLPHHHISTAVGRTLLVKKLSCMHALEFTAFRRSTVSRSSDSQPEKAPSSMDSKLSGNVTCFRLEHPPNEP